MNATRDRSIGIEDLRREVQTILESPPSDIVRGLLHQRDDWVITPEMGNLLSRLTRRISAQSILEFGAGRSSLILAHALHEGGGGRLTSVEHQPAYAEQAWRRMAEFSSVDARLVHAELGVRLSKHGLLHEYLGIASPLAARGPFDLVLIDAPPGHLGRDATLLAAGRYLADGALVILDDAARPKEQTSVRRWQRAFDAEVVFQSNAVAHGVVVLRLKRGMAPRLSLRTFLGTIHDRITERTLRG